MDKAEQILEALETQNFADFYNDEFDQYIVGEKDAPTKEEILKTIRRIFRRVIKD